MKAEPFFLAYSGTFWQISKTGFYIFRTFFASDIEVFAWKSHKPKIAVKQCAVLRAQVP